MLNYDLISVFSLTGSDGGGREKEKKGKERNYCRWESPHRNKRQETSETNTNQTERKLDEKPADQQKERAGGPDRFGERDRTNQCLFWRQRPLISWFYLRALRALYFLCSCPIWRADYRSKQYYIHFFAVLLHSSSSYSLICSLSTTQLARQVTWSL